MRKKSRKKKRQTLTMTQKIQKLMKTQASTKKRAKTTIADLEVKFP